MAGDSCFLRIFCESQFLALGPVAACVRKKRVNSPEFIVRIGDQGTTNAEDHQEKKKKRLLKTRKQREEENRGKKKRGLEE